ncbi:hypothetical protein CLPUN_09800 [Clostridium puniceum]|uniref:YqbQ/XkdQ domain-containing protein n=1 Tax=Clostridium puniceum TaxID=29367 RepID=A0A1S8TVN6_9CLOT|nr:hypothetical protein [Clostridium puniceum]OOM81796.1 hypothetical protein CLPUN_09800 [Clostridium puniceum]
MYKLISQEIDLMKYINQVKWNSETDTLGTQLSFDCLKDLKEGVVVSLWINDTEYFRGIVIKKTQKRWTFSYTCQDYSFYLKNKVIKQFNGISASEAIKSLLGEAYIVGNIVNIPTPITKIYTDNSLDEIIKGILDMAEKDQGIKYFKEIEGNILYVRKLEEMRIYPQILIPKGIDINSSIEDMKNSITIVSNEENNMSIIAKAEDTSQQPWFGVLSDIQTVDDKNISQAQNIADNLLLEKNKILKNASFEVMTVKDAETIKANRMIWVEAGSRMNGFYKIKSASHTLAKGTHKVSISLEW